jgi:hypothetical protein
MAEGNEGEIVGCNSPISLFSSHGVVTFVGHDPDDSKLFVTRLQNSTCVTLLRGERRVHGSLAT